MSESLPETFYPNFPTLVDALRWWSDKAPDRPAVAYLSDGENETARLTYAELDREARGVASRLEALIERGGRALLFFPPGLEFLAAYLGCLYAQVIAVPMLVPRNARHLDRLAAIVADAGATVALTDAKTAQTIEGKQAEDNQFAPLHGVTWHAVEPIGSQPAVSWQPSPVDPGSVAFLQYTSGSTATPNGVVVAHENLAVNIAMMGRSFDNHAGTRCVSWLPVHHDMGLIGCILQPLWQGLFTAFMPPISFIQDPARWLRAISRYRATFVSSPNLGYELCCRQARPEDIDGLDLSSLEVACNGAEPIRQETLDKFCDLFAPAGFRRSSFYPCYGLAEATLYASGHHLGRDAGVLVDRAGFELGQIKPPASNGAAHQVVSCGEAPAGQSLAIADPQTMRECPPDTVGEIWLSGDHIAKGYWNNASKTAEVFNATLPTRGATKFLRTGDLGFVRSGQLFVTGRLKDVIIAFGRNHYPQDIEATVAGNSAIRPGNTVAFALARDGAEGIGIVAEIERKHLRDDLGRLADSISAAVWEEHEVSVFQIVFLRPAALPKTSSGKLRRLHTRDLMLAGELRELFRWQGWGERRDQPSPDRPGGDLRQRLLSMPGGDRDRALLDLVYRETAVVLGRSSQAGLDPDRPLRETGLDSLRAADLRGRLAAATQLRLPATLPYDYPTPRALAARLAVLLGVDGAGEHQVAPAAEPEPEPAADEPIAIISMGCRFPGGATSPEALWDLLTEGRDAVSRFPGNRGWPGPGGDESALPVAGVLPDADEFDPGFFGISAREAIAIDPQQRLVLELSWEVLERAGIVPASLNGASCGVFVGISPNDYGSRLRDAVVVPSLLRGYLGTGSQPSVASGRIAYTLGLQGPAISVDTACSSSLVALHLACQSLRHGECTLAVAGGATVMATPAIFSELNPDSAGAPDGRCKAFSAEADGAGWSEGAGMVLLERLSDARRNAHPVLAVIRGSAVNQDGRSQGLTAPNGPAQQRVIRQALASARLSAGEIDAVEAHGTGTALGDPIEAQALLATYGQADDRDRPLWLGSLKSNLGHTQAAAGIAGVLKVVLALQHQVLPRTLHAANPSPHIDWSAGTMRLLNEPADWTGNGHPRRAGVSAFGISGTNAHVILEEAGPAAEQSTALGSTAQENTDPAPPPMPVPLSGRSAAALRAQARALSAYLAGNQEPRVADLAYSLATTRTHFEHRAVLVASDTAALREQLAALAAGQPTPDTAVGQADMSGKVVFVFPGHGPQWNGMALPLLETSEVFRAQLLACEQALAPHVDWSLLAVLRGLDGAPDMDEVDVIQPVLFSMMVSLAAVWRSMGVEPDAVVGHSLGETAAAYAAGALSLEDAAKIVALRGRALKRLAGRGAMAAVELPEEELRDRLARFGQRLSIAAVNGPALTLVSGAVDALDTLMQELASAHVFTRKIRVDYASHCEQVDVTENELRTALADVKPRTSRIPFYSTVTGERLDTARLDADYWFRNLRQPVRFADATQSLVADGYRCFVEASSHPALVVPLLQILERAAVPSVVVGSLRHDQGGMSSLLRSLGTLHARGLSPDWATFFRPLRRRRVDLPTYSFQRERFWLEDPGSRVADMASAGLEAAGHPVLAAAVALADGAGLVLTGRLSLSGLPWLGDHTMFGRVIVPASVFVELALEAAHWAGLGQVETLTLDSVLALPAQGGVTVQVTAGRPDAGGRRALDIYARDEATPDLPWIRHARGYLGPAATGGDSLRAWPPAGAAAVPLEGCYDRLLAAGLGYGPAFQGLRAVWRRDQEFFAEVKLPKEITSGPGQFGLHPVLLDTATRVAVLAAGERFPQPELSLSWSGVSLHATGATIVRIHLKPGGEAGTVSLRLADATGEPVATVVAVTSRPMSAGQLREELAGRDHSSLLRIDWTEPADIGASPPAGGIAVVGASALESLLDGSASIAQRHADFAAIIDAVDHGSPAPGLILVPCTAPAHDADVIAATHTATATVLALLQRWLTDERFMACRLVLLTCRTVAARPGEDVADLAHAPLWGLVRTTQTEHPDRYVCLVDTDGTEASRRVLAAALASRHSQLALRNGTVLVPRLTRVRGALHATDPAARAPSGRAAAPRQLRSDGTVLITGGTGMLGTLVARHLVHQHGARNLLLASRQGLAAAGARALRDELTNAGASVAIAACDVADRSAVKAQLAAIPAEHPLTAVIHAAGVLDGIVLTALTADQLHKVLRVKADAAWHLHELTMNLDLSAFVMFSSAAGVLGAPGQANYSAASTFLDALAQHRAARGLPALAIDWALWAEKSSLTAHLGKIDYQRVAQVGMRPLTTSEGLSFLDAALNEPHPVLTAANFDLAAHNASAQAVLPIIAELSRARPPRPVAANRPSPTTLRQRLLSLPPAEAADVMLDVVQTEAAAVLGLGAPTLVEAERSLESLGLDSLRSLELKNRLSAAIDLTLPAYLLRERGVVVELAGAILEKVLIHMTSQATGVTESAPAPDRDDAYQEEVL
jgi:acyl transferase domain-containing protein/acyl-CoA synthetase (AMP-forming)/AMP-acid ligase II/acyl carrier protein